MSELIEQENARLSNLYDFANSLVNGENGRQLILRYKDYLDTITPSEAMIVLDKLLVNNPFERVKEYTGKIINVFFRSLNSFHWEKPGPGHFLTLLMLENRAVEKIMDEIRLLTKSIFSNPGLPDNEVVVSLRSLISELAKYELHYIKKENILFPVIEKTFPQYRCLQLMWSFHDDFRNSIRNLDKLLDSELDKTQFNKEIGRLFFVVLPIIFREEQIVFPVAFRAIPSDEWDEMLAQGNETGWCYLDNIVIPVHKTMEKKIGDGKFDLGTGIMTLEQIISVFRHLPVDLTLVDENDTVTFFSEGQQRIFPRSAAIIGRKVQNCHPPESVHVVNEIIDAFRNRTRDFAEFWIRMKGRFIHIRYFAVRDTGNKYQGTLEVTQDVTGIRELEGERRLLDWN